MKLLDFLNENSNWKEILTNPPYNITVKEDGEYILLKYSQIDSDLSNELVKQCRGCIFKKENDRWKYVCRPFEKFFNAEEPNADKIDWSGFISITEKIDGSLIKIFYDNGEWHCATNSTINAKNALVENVFNQTYFDIVEKALGKPFLEFVTLLENNKEYTHLFELVSPITRVVVPYDEYKLYYLTSINTENGEEDILPILKKNFATPQRLLASSLKEVQDVVKTFEWTREDFVVYDGKHRVKVKSPAYIKAHYARNNGHASMASLLDVVLYNEIDEFLTYADMYAQKIEEIKERIENIQKEYDTVYKYCADNGLTNKEAAFYMRDNNVNAYVRGFVFKSLTFNEKYDIIKEMRNNCPTTNLRALGYK